MNQRLQHIVEHYDEMCIGTDEHFRVIGNLPGEWLSLERSRI